MNEDERRSYIRHPVDVPVQIYPQSHTSTSHVHMSDVGKGGIALRSSMPLNAGILLRIAIPHVHPPFEESCVVCWCQAEGDGFEVGIRFLEPESMFKARMVEQICHIEDYRSQENSKGRQLSAEEAACEWIGKYAADFGLN